MSNAGFKYWMQATRPKTLAAGIMPVAIGSATAYYYGNFDFYLSFIALICAILIQIVTNFLNEVYDFKRGADTEERKGPQRIVAAGIVSARKMFFVSLILIFITFLLGMILVLHAGIPVLIIGALSLLFAYAYTGGPYPLAYNGLGDIFVLIFFGIVAVCGTFYVQTLKLTSYVFVASLAPGFLSMNLLGVNNIRDIQTDKPAQKLTLAVKLGRYRASVLYAVINILAFIVPILLFFMLNSLWMLLPLILLPYSLKITMNVFKYEGKELNKLLAATSIILLGHGLLTILGFILAK